MEISSRVFNHDMIDGTVSPAYSAPITAQLRVHMVREELRGYISVSICWMFIHMSFSGCIISEIPLILAMVPTLIYYTIMILTTAPRYRALPDKIPFFFLLGEHLCILLATIIVISAYVTMEVRYICAILPLGIGETLRLLHLMGKYNNCTYLLKSIKILFSITRLLQAMNASLKFDGVLHWNWFLVFWPAFLDIAIIGILGIFSFLMLIRAVLSNLSHEEGHKEYACSIWAIFTCIGGSASIGSFLIYLSLILESHSDMQVIATVSISPILFYIFFPIFTHLYLTQISYWFFHLFSGPFVMPISPVPVTSPSNIVNTPILLLAKATTSTLKRISTTYFQSTDSAPSSIELKLNNTYIVDEEEKSPIICRRRSNSLNIPKVTPESKPGDIKLCMICMRKAANGVIMNCGHGGVCHTCAVKILKETGVCHLCRKSITEVLKVKTPYKKYVKVISATLVKSEDPITNSE
jgi:hypothetical protein